jgi:hypothetical protein
MSKSLVSIDNISALICDELGDTSGTKYEFRISQYLALGYQKMHLFLDQETSFKSQILQLGSVVEMPRDFVYETKVGIERDGHICVLNLSTDRMKSHVQKKDSEMRDMIDRVLDGTYVGRSEDAGHYFYNSFGTNGDFLGELYGVGSGFFRNGMYDIDRKRGCISVGSLLPSDANLIVEYKSDGISEGLNLVPSEMFLALRYFALAEFYKEGETGTNRNMYYNEYQNLKRLYTFKPISVLAGLFKSSHLTAPR